MDSKQNFRRQHAYGELELGMSMENMSWAKARLGGFERRSSLKDLGGDGARFYGFGSSPLHTPT